MPRWPDVTRMNTGVLFLLMGLCALVVAWLSFGLINLAMANADFLLKHRLMALVEGGGWQAALLALRGLAMLAAYLGFKVIEVELVSRWRRPRG